MDPDRPELASWQARLISRRRLLALLGAGAAAGIASPVLAVGIRDDDDDEEKEKKRKRRQKRKKKELPDVPVAVIAPLLGLVGFGAFLALRRRREQPTPE